MSTQLYVKRGLTPRQQTAWMLYARDPHSFVFGAHGERVLTTKDEHRSDAPEQYFPDLPYLRCLFDCLLVSGHFLEPGKATHALAWGLPEAHLAQMEETGMVFIEKSRQIMASWLCCAYLLWRAKFHSHQLLLVQSKREEDAAKFVYEKEPQQARISFMESRLPIWLQDGLFTGTASIGTRMRKMAQRCGYGHLYFPNGSHLWAVPQGGDVIRSNTPSCLFCVGEDTKVLTKDLRWVDAGSVQVGDELTAFANGQKNHWYWRTSTVLGTGRVRRPSYRLTFDDGTTIIASAEHKWLVGGHHQHRHWRTTEDLRVQRGGRAGSLVVRLLDVWEADRSYEAGYVAGFVDGEGYLTQRQLARGGWNTKLGIVQNAGPTLDALQELLRAKGFSFYLSSPHGKCHHVWIAKRAHIMEFLGKIRPPRLLGKFNPDTFGLIQAPRASRVIEREYLGEQEVVGFKTTTGTFIAEGLASHNSDESAFQPEFGLAYQAALPALRGGGQGIFVSSAEVGDFATLVEAEVDKHA